MHRRNFVEQLRDLMPPPDRGRSPEANQQSESSPTLPDDTTPTIGKRRTSIRIAALLLAPILVVVIAALLLERSRRPHPRILQKDREAVVLNNAAPITFTQLESKTQSSASPSAGEDAKTVLQRSAAVENATETESTPEFDEPDGFYGLVHHLENNVPEIDLDSIVGSSQEILSSMRDREGVPDKPDNGQVESESAETQTAMKAFFELASHRSDLSGLPFRKGSQCRLDQKSVESMREISRTIGSVRSPRLGTTEAVDLEPKLIELLSSRSESWNRPEAVSTLVQMLEVEEQSVRLELIKLLSTIEGAEASLALAERTLFDLSSRVRRAAAESLRDRPASEYRKRLLEGFRYPWPPVAQHAAQALVRLEDQEVVKELIDLLDRPDPAAPIRDEQGEWVKTEMVRVNHLRNCLLCHPPARRTTKQVAGIVPTPGRPLSPAYYHGRRGTMARADIVYLRQDFSAIQVTSEFHPWPIEQRYDYLLRTRRVADESSESRGNRGVGLAAALRSYPQRDSVLFALRELTGRDAGQSSEDWFNLHDAGNDSDLNN